METEYRSKLDKVMTEKKLSNRELLRIIERKHDIKLYPYQITHIRNYKSKNARLLTMRLIASALEVTLDDIVGPYKNK